MNSDAFLDQETSFRNVYVAKSKTEGANIVVFAAGYISNGFSISW